MTAATTGAGKHDPKAKDVAFIGDSDSVLGFEALGVRAVVAPSSPEQAVASFRKLVREQTQVIIITEEYLDSLSDEISAISDRPTP
ncbi:V-type ATP synthase subunit F, partial [Candidatus Fermentibacterales bacterium]|nr:V-type ATP synthase subunit F [Candidatus Fermentibacterales bacterium]